MKDQLVKPVQPALRVMLGAVAVVLLIVCANVANLLLARGTTRRREIAVRAALGASRGRLMRLVAAECAVLALAGGLAGALIGAGGVWLVKAMAVTEADGFFRLISAARCCRDPPSWPSTCACSPSRWASRSATAVRLRPPAGTAALASQPARHDGHARLQRRSP